MTALRDTMPDVNNFMTPNVRDRGWLDSPNSSYEISFGVFRTRTDSVDMWGVTIRRFDHSRGLQGEWVTDRAVSKLVYSEADAKALVQAVKLHPDRSNAIRRELGEGIILDRDEVELDNGTIVAQYSINGPFVMQPEGGLRTEFWSLDALMKALRR